jgi:glycosyltransferase involved in cell wall biosynthesis
MKAKIAYFCSSESWGGLEMNHLKEAGWMLERGHEIKVFAVQGTPFYNNCESAGLQVIGIQKQKKYYDFKMARSLKKELVEFGATHFIFRSTYDMSIAASIKFKLKESITTVYCQEMQLGVKKTNFLHTFRFKQVDVWRSTLNYLSEQVKTWTKFKNKLVVIPSGLDLDKLSIKETPIKSREQLGLPKETTILGLIGRFDPQKGQLLLLDAISKTKNNNYHVVLLGEPTKNEGDHYHELMLDLINKSELSDRVHVLPFMQNPTSFYNAIDWLIMATKAETFGMVTIESIACGTPVIGSNAGGTPELLENETAGMLFESMNANSLASTIDRIMSDKISFSSEELRKKAQVYDKNKVCEALENAIGLG